MSDSNIAAKLAAAKEITSAVKDVSTELVALGMNDSDALRTALRLLDLEDTFVQSM